MLFDVVSSDNRGLRSVMVLAHNPGTEMLASMLANQSLEMVTAAAAVFEVDDLDVLGKSSVSGHAPLSHLLNHLTTQCSCELMHIASPKTI